MTADKRRTDGRKRRWQQHNADRRQAVIDAAITVLRRDLTPGEDLSVQQIADESGVHRTVLYRYFEDRTDLDLAIQREICQQAGTMITAAVTLEGTPQQIVRRVIGAYVDWSVDNIGLMRFAERELPGSASKPLDDAIGQIAEAIEIVIGGFLAILDAEVSDDLADVLTPFVYLLVGGVMSAVHSWTTREELRPPAADFTRLLAEIMWLQISGVAAAQGIEVPDVPVEQLLNLEENL